MNSTTPDIIHEPETATQEPQEQLKYTTPEQRVAPQHINTNATMDNTLHPMVNDKAAITPATDAIEALVSPMKQNILPELPLVAPNIPFPRMSTK